MPIQKIQRCEGCDRPGALTKVDMKYGGSEWLCDDCIRESSDLIGGTQDE